MANDIASTQANPATTRAPRSRRASGDDTSQTTPGIGRHCQKSQGQGRVRGQHVRRPLDVPGDHRGPSALERGARHHAVLHREDTEQGDVDHQPRSSHRVAGPPRSTVRGTTTSATKATAYRKSTTKDDVADEAVAERHDGARRGARADARLLGGGHASSLGSTDRAVSGGELPHLPRARRCGGVRGWSSGWARPARPTGLEVAFATAGHGPPLLFVGGWLSHLELSWALPAERQFLEGLAHGRTLLRYDRPGCGLSDRSRSASPRWPASSTWSRPSSPRPESIARTSWRARSAYR